MRLSKQVHNFEPPSEGVSSMDHCCDEIIFVSSACMNKISHPIIDLPPTAQYTRLIVPDFRNNPRRQWSEMCCTICAPVLSSG